MNRIASSFAVGALALGVVSLSYAKPPAAPATAAAAPPASAPAKAMPPPAAAPPSNTPGKTVVIYYKPSKDGSDVAPHANDKAAALLKCNSDSVPEKNFSIVIQDGKAFCQSTKTNVLKTALTCLDHGTLTSDDKFPAAVKTAYGPMDQCLTTGAPPDLPASYVKVRCSTDSTGSGQIQMPLPGPDTCEKIFNYAYIQLPGLPPSSGVVMSPSVIGGGKVAHPSQPQIDANSVKCPAGAVLEADGNAVLCKKN